MPKHTLILLTLLISATGTSAIDTTPCRADSQITYDLVIYGGTSAGIAAAVQAKRMGASVVVIEPTSRIGGLTTGGLGQTDIGNKAAIGGISREFYQRIRRHYQEEANWKWENSSAYRSGGQSRTDKNEDTMWTFEPSAALLIMRDLVKEHDIQVVLNARLDRTPHPTENSRVSGVVMNGNHIVEIRTEDKCTFRGRCFIDATYEGDLLAGAGVSFTVGREATTTYDESLNGVQTRRAIHHQLKEGIDPYRMPGVPESGLLPGIDPTGPGEEGAADHRVQAFCFRMCLTDIPENQIPVTKPGTYDESQYELLFRNFEAGAKVLPWSFSLMPNRKTDINNNRGMSTDFIGQSYQYPNASYKQRETIVRQHLIYQQGLLWTLANHPRVPAEMRAQVSKWAPCRDEFVQSGGWQKQLYIREARRMIGEVVMTQNHCQGKIQVKKPVGLAAYTMDSHNVQRYVDENGHTRNEGDVQVGGFPPYGIEYGSLTPKYDECKNLLVPVCLSASHIAFGSIRMEPVFMVLGQTAAAAGVQAVRKQTSVQAVDYDVLRRQLIKDKQVLTWNKEANRSPLSRPVSKYAGTVLDDDQSTRLGFDSISQSTGPFLGNHYRHDSNAAKGKQTAKYKFKVKKAGNYNFQIAWSAHSNRATNVPITIKTDKRTHQIFLDQTKKPDKGMFGSIGNFTIPKGEVTVTVENANTDGYVILDGMRILAAETSKPN
jgi:hypothetical protein